MATKKRSITASEAQEQSAFIDWTEAFQIKVQGDQRPLRRHTVASLNGAWLAGDKKQRAKQVAALKSQGLLTGVCDIFIALPSHVSHGLWIEFKRQKKNGGKPPTEDQRRVAKDLRMAGYTTAVAYGAEDGRRATLAYLSGRTIPEDLLFPFPKG